MEAESFRTDRQKEGWTDGRKDKQTDMKKQVVCLLKFAIALKRNQLYIIKCQVYTL